MKLFSAFKREKQQKQESGGADVPESFRKRFEERGKAQEATTRIERSVSGWEKLFKASLFALALSNGAQAEDFDRESSGRPSEQYLEAVNERNEKEVAVLLARNFTDSQKIIEECGGAVKVKIHAQREDAPTVVHIRWNHGSSGFETLTDKEDSLERSILSSYLVKKCFIAMIETYSGEAPLPINFEWRESVSSIDYENSLRRDGPRRTDQALESMFFQHIFQSTLLRLRFRDAQLNIDNYIDHARHFQHVSEEEMRQLGIRDAVLPIIGLIDRYVMKDTVRRSITMGPDAMMEMSVDILRHIEESKNVVFGNTDIPINQDVSEESHETGDTGNEAESLFREMQKEFHSTYTERERVAFNQTVSGMNGVNRSGRGSGDVSLLLFGASHDFSNEAFEMDVNLVEINTDMMTRRLNDISVSNAVELFRIAASEVVISEESFMRWMEEQGGAEMVMYNLLSIGKYDFIIRHWEAFQKIPEIKREQTLANILRRAVKEGYGYLIFRHDEIIIRNLPPETVKELRDKVS